jgi:hypothetical protein
MSAENSATVSTVRSAFLSYLFLFFDWRTASLKASCIRLSEKIGIVPEIMEVLGVDKATVLWGLPPYSIQLRPSDQLTWT